MNDVCEIYHDKLEQDYKLYQPSETFESVVSKVDILHMKNKVTLFKKSYFTKIIDDLQKHKIEGNVVKLLQ